MRLRLTVAGLAVVALFIGTAVAGRKNAIERDALVRARVWCESVERRDALRYQETFRRGHFRGTFDRAANRYLEPTEAAIHSEMVQAKDCAPAGVPRGPGPRGDVYAPVSVDGRRVELRMRRESGFFVVYQVVDA